MRKKSVGAVSVIGGADGPTSVFIASRQQKLTLKQKFQKKRYALRRKRAERQIRSGSHSIEEVCHYVQKWYGYTERDKETVSYQQEYESMRYSYMLQYAPELLGDAAKIPELTDDFQEGIQAYLQDLKNTQKASREIPQEDFDIKLHILEKENKDGSNFHILIEETHGYISGGGSGSRKAMRKFEKIYRDIYQYYGVTDLDIQTKSERYEELVSTLAR